MDEEKDRTGSVALVQVWGKGFRVTEDTEEFQRCVPSKSVEISLLEKKLATLVWGPILEPLYRMSEREVGAQRCVLFDATQLLAVSFSKSEDKHGRPSIVLTTACVEHFLVVGSARCHCGESGWPRESVGNGLR